MISIDRHLLIPWVDRSWCSPLLDHDLCLVVGGKVRVLVELSWYAGDVVVERLGARARRAMVGRLARRSLRWLFSDLKRRGEKAPRSTRQLRRRT